MPTDARVAHHPRCFLRGLGVWGLLLGFALVNGLFRAEVLEPYLGPEAAHLLSTTALAGAVFLAALIFVRAATVSCSPTDLLALGVAWALLTGALEVLFGLARGLDGSDLFADFEFTRGRLFGLVLLAELASPPIAGFLRRSQGGRSRHRAA